MSTSRIAPQIAVSVIVAINRSEYALLYSCNKYQGVTVIERVPVSHPQQNR